MMPATSETSTPTTLTLDTNLLWEHWRNQAKASCVQDLLELNRNGQVDLAVTSRIHADIPDEPRASSLKEDLDKLDVVKIGSVTRLDSWRLGVDRLPCERFLKVESSICNRRRTPTDPKLPDHRDWDHLHGHHLANRDVFLTWDKPVLRLADELRKCLDLILMAPEEFLKNHRHLTPDGTSGGTEDRGP